MNNSKYNDTTAVVQVIGCILRDPSLIQNDGTYYLTEDDFVHELHYIIFGSMRNLANGGADKFNVKIIEDYLEYHPKSLEKYKRYKGAEWILEAIKVAEPSNFDYNYQRVKKMTLLRAYDDLGIDVSDIYNPDLKIIDDKEVIQKQEENFDKYSLEDIAEEVDKRVDAVKENYLNRATDDSVNIGDDLDNFMKSLEETPDYGGPLYGKLVNTVSRGTRKGKFFIRSAASGVGKSRSMIADACISGCREFYDLKTQQWFTLGRAIPTVFISTELELDEVRTMALAFLSGVDEEHILTNSYNAIDNELERVQHAVEILKESKLRVETIPNFSLQDIENIIKRNIRLYQVENVFFDYIHTSMKILEEITRRSGGVKLREDNILFLLAVKLKDICVQYDIFILSSTQLNADWKTSPTPDQNLLRGAKSIADKVDWGAILLDATPEDVEEIAGIVEQVGCKMPNIKMSVYKNRRGKYTKCFVWMIADKSICRFDPVFITDYQYNYIPAEKTLLYKQDLDEEPKESWTEEEGE